MDRDELDRQELEKLRPFLGTNEDFFPTDAEADELVDRVSARIADEPAVTSLPRVYPLFQRVAAVAAAVVLMIGAAWIGYRMGGSDTDSVDLSADVSSTGVPTVQDSLSELYALEEAQLDALLFEATSDHGQALTNDLLYELSDEEIDELKNTLDVGDLLL